MKTNAITIRHAILIAKPRELVWDYTQDYEHRCNWDESVLEAIVLQTTPHRVVKLRLRGGTTMTFVYKLDQRPSKTTLAAKEIHSPIISNAGGSWIYEEKEGETLWMQVNTLVLKKHFLSKPMLPLYKWLFTRMTKRAMRKAKEIIESTRYE